MATDYPRTSTVLKAFGIVTADRWMEPRYARMGRYIHEGCAHLAAGHELNDAWFEEWFTRTSGEGDKDRVVHEECRPKMNGYAKFQRDHKPKLLAAEQELVHPVYGYSCHPDQILTIGLDFCNTIGPYSARSEPDPLVLLELKSGMEMDWHELQIASYMLAVEYHYKRRPKPMALYLEPDDYRLVPLPDPWRACQEWIALIACWNVLHKYHSRLVEA